MKHTYHNERATTMVSLLPWADGIWLISHVWTHRKHRKRGQATALLKQVCEEADTTNTSLILTVDGDYDYTWDGLSNDQLEEWYKKFGFVVYAFDPTTGIHTTMVRLKEGHEVLVEGIFRG